MTKNTFFYGNGLSNVYNKDGERDFDPMEGILTEISDPNVVLEYLNQFLEILFLFVRIFYSWKHIEKWKKSKRILYSLQTKRSHLRAKTVGSISNNGSKCHWPQNWYYYRLVWITCRRFKPTKFISPTVYIRLTSSRVFKKVFKWLN